MTGSGRMNYEDKRGRKEYILCVLQNEVKWLPQLNL